MSLYGRSHSWLISSGSRVILMDYVNLSEAKTHLSRLVDRAASSETVIIAKNGVPFAKLVPFVSVQAPRQPAHWLGLSYIAPDFDALDTEIVALWAR